MALAFVVRGIIFWGAVAGLLYFPLEVAVLISAVQRSRIRNFLRQDSSDNLIHWDFNIRRC